MQYNRNYDFQTGTTIVADQIDQEFDAVAGVINGNINEDNLTDVAVTEAKIATDAVTTTKIKDGNVTMPKVSNPYKFKAYRNATQAITTATWTTVQLNAEAFDPNSNFDTSTYMYTVPVTGYYLLTGCIGISAADGVYTIAAIYKNIVTTPTTGTWLAESRDTSPNATSANKYVNVTYYGELTAGDVVYLVAYMDDTTSPTLYANSTYLGGFLESI